MKLNHRLNWKPDRPDFRDFKYSMHPESQKAVQLPPAMDLRSKMSPVVNQYDIGSCTGNAIAGNLEMLELLEIRQNLPVNESPEVFVPGKFASISRLFIYYNERVLEGDPDQDNGAQIRDGVLAIRKWGICRESVWGYSDANALVKPSDAAYHEALAHKASVAYRISNYSSIDQMKTCLVHGYPFVFGVAVYSSFMSNSVARTGMVPMPSRFDQMEGGHAILCCGYDDSKKVFIVKNSWGAYWGDKGYCYIPYDYMGDADLCADLWTIRRVP